VGVREVDERFEAFVEQHYGQLLRYAMVLTGDRDDAGDVVHDTLLKLVKHIGRRDIEEMAAYARATLFRVFVRRRTRRRREPPVAEVLLPAADPDIAGRWAGRRDMVALLAQLPPRMRAVLAARFYLDLTEAGTAQLLGCSVGTVKSMTSRGLQRLRAAWEAEQVTAPAEDPYTSPPARSRARGHR
jgi:RNA polymerase sigma factor (sigma-70 family)